MPTATVLREHSAHGPDSRAIASVFREPDRSPRGIEAFLTYALAMPFLTISLLAASLVAAPPRPVVEVEEPRRQTIAAAMPTTTIISHGFANGSKGAWAEAMATAILVRAGGDGAVYRYTGESGVLTRDLDGGGNGSSANVVIVFNWAEDSGFIDEGPDWNYAQAAGDAMQAMLRDAAYAEPGVGPSDLIAGRTVHFIGHSRGAIVNSEAIRRLAIAGLPVDQMTSLDAHPVNGTLDARYDLDWGDPVPVRWSNVVWADNYWRADGGGIFNGLDFDGIPIANTFDVQLSESVLNCCAYSFAHSDVHLWYFGTIDLSPNPSNGEQTITNTMRNTWWPGGFDVVGFNRSAIGGGERPTIPPGVDPDPASAPLLENGGFTQGSRAGWSYHGGVGASVLQSGSEWFARLSAARPALVHNRMFLPSPPPGQALRLRFEARRSSSAATNDLFEMALARAEDEAPVGLPDALWAVAELEPGFVERSALVPAAFHGRTATLLVELLGGGDAIGSTVDLDRFVLEFVPAEASPDLDGNGMVDGADLAVLLGDWGACEGCAADLDGNGSVDGADLAVLLGAWGG